MKKFIQEKIFLKSEADKYFERNGPKVNKFIIDAIKFIKPNKNHKIFEIGCGSGATLKKIKTIYKSNVSGLDTSKKAVRPNSGDAKSSSANGGYTNLTDNSSSSNTIDVKTCFTEDSECSTSGNVSENSVVVE